MAQKKGSGFENTFGQGYVTEATGLNFPKDAASDCSNVVFNQDMSVTRRLGFDIEDNSTAVPGTFNSGHVTEYLWKNVAGVANLTFLVTQVGSTITIFDTVNPHSLSSNVRFTFNLNTYKLTAAPDTKLERCQYTEGLGKLFIAHAYCDPIRVVYLNGAFTVLQSVIRVRDFTGVVDGVQDDRPSTLTIQHKYNLYNQGWSVIAPVGQDSKTLGPAINVLTGWNNSVYNFPSNVDYWWVSKDALGQFNASHINIVSLGNTNAPKGHYILEAFAQNRQAAIQKDIDTGADANLPVTGNVSDLISESSGYYRPSVIAFYSGRVFYTGVNFNSQNVNYSNKIYFSRIIEKDDHIGQCYQDGDPTAEDGSDLLPSDGGVIDSPEIGTIHKIFPVGYSLIIFASNGIWSISGSTGTGFTAKDYSIAKISSQGIVSDSTFVDMDGTPVWWTLTSISTLQGEQGGDSGTSTGSSVGSISDKSIKRFITGIPDISKYYIKGSYNRVDNTITWLYRSNSTQNLTQNYQYDSALTLNTLSKAFSKWTLPNTKIISGIVSIQSFGFAAITKFIINQTTTFTFAELRRTDYFDYGVQDYLSFVETGHSLEGQGVAKFYTPYVFMYIDGTGGELNFYHKWNFSNDPTTFKFSPSQRVYATTGYDVETVRKKIRGSGRAVKLRFESTSGQPFGMFGWATLVSANSGP